MVGDEWRENNNIPQYYTSKFTLRYHNGHLVECYCNSLFIKLIVIVIMFNASAE